MIAKHVPMRSQNHSDFAGLVKYITDEQGMEERLGLVNTTNCAAETMEAVIGEVLATQRMNTRAEGDKTYHLIVSFRSGEAPDKDTLRAIESRICGGLGFGEHQRVSAVHNDTDNLHMHIAINKIHPTRHTMHEPFQSYRAMAKLCETLEAEYGLQRDNHTNARTLSEGRANDMEQHAGIESLVSWVRRTCLEDLRDARTWKGFHDILHENGLELRERANGFVIQDIEDRTMIKASTVARDLSKPKLEERLGVFESMPREEGHRAKRKYDKRPIRFKVDTTELYAQYRDEQAGLTEARSIEWAGLKGDRDRHIKAAQRTSRLKRAAIKLSGESRATKKLLYAQTHRAFRAQLKAINKRYAQDKADLYAKHKRHAWADWLKDQALQGNTVALDTLRARESKQALSGCTVTGTGASNAPAVDAQAPMDNITKRGTVIYRAGQGSVRDDGDRLKVSNSASFTVVKEALSMAASKYGNRITLTGTPEFKAQAIQAAALYGMDLTFSDPAIESRRKELSQKLEVRRDERGRSEHERRDYQRRGRSGRGAGRSGRGVAGHGGGRQSSGVSGSEFDRPGGRAGTTAGNDKPRAGKPNVAGVGREAPPERRNRLRNLSSLSVVRFTDGGEVLLPSDVPRHMEQQGAKSTDALRRAGSGTGRLTQPDLAAEKYIQEREGKRAQGFDIPKHALYNSQSGLTYGGTRLVDGQHLALLKQGDTTLVKPIDKATAQRLKRYRVGEAVTVTQKGSLRKSKGRSR